MKKVLIVDDTTFMRESLKLMLKRNGFDVVGEAENGLVALKKYLDLKPDIVTMDITMPQADGLQALKMIKEVDPDCKIVMISALGQEAYVREAVLSGAKGFIVKPFKEQFVVESLNKILGLDTAE